MSTMLWLIIIANSAPVLMADVLGRRWARPIDGGRVLADGRPLLGASKTWRGLITAVSATALVAPLFGLHWSTGAAAGLLSMLGDLIASFSKRRLGLAPGDRSRLLDAIPEALLPTLALRERLTLSWFDVILVPLLFAAIVRYLSPILYRLHVRQRPW